MSTGARKRKLGFVALAMSAVSLLGAGPAAALINPISHRFREPRPAPRVQRRAPAPTTTSMPRRSPPAHIARDLVLSDIKSPAITEIGYTFTLRAVAGDGRTATGYGGTVVFMSTDRAAEVDASPYTFVPDDGGEHVFTVTFHTPGRHWLHVNDTVNLSLSTEQGGIVVTDDPGALVAAAVAAASRAQALANGVAAQAVAASTSSSTSTTSTTSTTSLTGSTTSTVSSGSSSTSSSSSTSTTLGSGSTTSTTPSSTTSTTLAGGGGSSGSSSSTSSSSTSSTLSSSSSISSTSTSVAVRREAAEVSNPRPQQGQTVQVTGRPETFAPDRDLKVELHSDPVVLAPAKSASDGSYIADVTIPEDASPGEHEIVVAGPAFDRHGMVESFAKVTIVSSGLSSSGSTSAGSSSSGGGSTGDSVSSGAGSAGSGSESGSSGSGGTSLGRTGWSPGLLKLALALALIGIVLVRSGTPDLAADTDRSRL